MLYVIAIDNSKERKKHIATLVDRYAQGECIVLDDAMISAEDLEQFLYPSLFSPSVPVIHGKYFLDRWGADAVTIKKFVASPTIFIFEELAVAKPLATILSKNGAQLTTKEKEPSKKKEGDVFAVTACITAKDKKARWLAFRSALETQPIEALLGILYWKLRTLSATLPVGNKYEQLYRAFLDAQKRAWQRGVALDALIEKIILEQ